MVAADTPVRPPAAVSSDVSAEMTEVLANMVESALAGGLLAAEAVASVGSGDVRGGDARGAEGDRVAPAAHRNRLHSTVNAGAGARAHRVHRPPVRACRGG